MKREMIEINGQKYPLLRDGVLLGSWEDIPKSDGRKVQTITKDPADEEVLDGLIIRGYETKFGKVNGNFEFYEKDCIDKFIKEYFVGNKLNMPVDVQHDERDVCGKVLYIEVNTTGFYFVAYVPREYPKYDWLKAQLRLGIIQGFSKFGFATEWEWEKDADGEYYQRVKEMRIVSMSLVTTPANAIPFERMQEVKNSTRFVSTLVDVDEPDAEDALTEMFK